MATERDQKPSGLSGLRRVELYNYLDHGPGWPLFGSIKQVALEAGGLGDTIRENAQWFLRDLEESEDPDYPKEQIREYAYEHVRDELENCMRYLDEEFAVGEEPSCPTSEPEVATSPTKQLDVIGFFHGENQKAKSPNERVKYTILDAVAKLVPGLHDYIRDIVESGRAPELDEKMYVYRKIAPWVEGCLRELRNAYRDSVLRGEDSDFSGDEQEPDASQDSDSDSTCSTQQTNNP